MNRYDGAGCDAAPVTSPEGNAMRRIVDHAGRILAGALILSALQIASSLVLETGDYLNDAGWIFLSNLLVVLILAYSAVRADAAGLKLAGAVFLVYWGVYSFNTNVEAVFFDLSIPHRTLIAIMAQGLLLGVIFAPVLILLLGKWVRCGDGEGALRGVGEQASRGAGEYARPEAGEHASRGAGENARVETEEHARHGTGEHARRMAAPGVLGLLWRLAVCDLSYVLLYLVAGAAAFPYLQDFYADAASIPPLGRIVGMQLFRGLIYAGVTYPLIRIMRGKRLGKAVVVGLQLSILGAVAPLLLPNPYMPPAIRMVHAFEVGISNFLYGAIIGLLLSGKSDEIPQERQEQHYSGPYRGA